MNLHDPDFVAGFSRVVRRGGRWRNCEPVELVAQWSGLVSNCISGFSGGVEDYFNELTSRDDLEDAINAPELSRFSEIWQVKDAVLAADGEFGKILIPDVFPKFPASQWWNRGIVRYAGPCLVKELRQAYGITIDAVVQGGG